MTISLSPKGGSSPNDPRTEMIERVAKALSKRQLGSDHHWKEWTDMAVVAMEAMRDPTEEMRKAFYALDQVGEPTGCIEGWQAMVDAALGQPVNNLSNHNK